MKANGQLFCQVQSFFVVGRKSDRLLENQEKILTMSKKFRIFLDRIRVFPWKLVMKQQGTFLSALTEQMTGS